MHDIDDFKYEANKSMPSVFDDVLLVHSVATVKHSVISITFTPNTPAPLDKAYAKIYLYAA